MAAYKATNMRCLAPRAAFLQSETPHAEGEHIIMFSSWNLDARSRYDQVTDLREARAH